MIREQTLPMKLSDEELADLERRAAAEGLRVSEYVRIRLGLPLTSKGRSKTKRLGA